MQLQLQTDSRDHGDSSATAPVTETAGSGGAAAAGWSWFELVVFRDKDATEPLERDGKLLAWRSHGNRTDPLDTANSVSRHFGVVFDRRQALLDILEVRAFFSHLDFVWNRC